MVRMLLIAAGLIAGAETPAHLPGRAGAFINGRLHVIHYKAASVDLNDDGAPEVLVYADAPSDCGSGGCNLYVLTPEGASYRMVTHVGVTRLPIRILPHASHGWRDLGVQVAGGGITRAYEARLMFDGRTYPDNPTVPPARPLANTTGRILLK